ncbi:MAG TPA: hypothetical protein VJL58_02320 [Pyrinomonadaceae bacterium]|nr:hypothetical protein [Pyrinomonadaceae bacterium]
MVWISEYWQSLTLNHVLFAGGIFVASLLLNILVIGFVFVKIPPHYFSSHYQDDFLPNSSWITRWGAVVLKNLAGLFMVIVGIIQLVGPGQGILSILTGLILMDIPGKRPLEARIVKRPTVLAAINKLRAKYGREPLVVD